MSIRSDYLKPLFNSEKLIDIADKVYFAITKESRFEGNFQNDSIVVKGYSSALVSPIVSHWLRCPLILVREKENRSHSSLPVEGNDSVRKYIIIDDCLISGQTIKDIVKAMDEFQPKARLIGIVLYGKNDKQQMQSIANRYDCFVKSVYGKQVLVNPELGE